MTSPASFAFDVEALDNFLMSDRSPENCMQIADLDGFLTGIVVGPELIYPSEWLRVIWKGGQPKFTSVDEANFIVGMVMARYNEIIANLQGHPDDYQPILLQMPDGTFHPADWAEGFVDAVRLRVPAWQTLFRDPVVEHLIPIVELASDEVISAMLLPHQFDRRAMWKTVSDRIPEAVFAIDHFWKTRRQPSSIKVCKTGRNAPCPCGSGRKYKRCCGAN